MKISRTLLVLLFGFACGTALAQWVWVDKDGRKVFSDRAPPPDVGEKDILKRPNGNAKSAATVIVEPPPAAATLPVTPSVDKDIEAKKKQLAESEAAKVKTEQDRVAKIKAENCARAKQAKATFDSGVRVSTTNASGEREVLDDAGRAVEGKRIQSVIDSDCK
jgi:type IV secretory pathway VirB10-like protein